MGFVPHLLFLSGFLTYLGIFAALPFLVLPIILVPVLLSMQFFGLDSRSFLAVFVC